MLLGPRTVSAYAALVSDQQSGGGGGNLSTALLERHGLLTTHLFWRVSPAAVELAHQWLVMALDEPNAFCASHTQDQAAFTVLAANRSLPLADMCPFLRPPWLNNKCFDQQKLLSAAVRALGKGQFELRPL